MTTKRRQRGGADVTAQEVEALAARLSWEHCKDCGTVYLTEAGTPPQQRGACPNGEIAPGSIVRHHGRHSEGTRYQVVTCKDCEWSCWYPAGATDATLCVDCRARRAVNEGEVQLLLGEHDESPFNFEIDFGDQAAINRLIFDAVRSESRSVCVECEGPASLLFLPVASSSRPPFPAGTKAARVIPLCESCSAGMTASQPPPGSNGPN